MFVFAGLAHFAKPETYAAIIPSYLPAPLALVFVSGFFEVLGGIAVLLPRLRIAAGWGLITLLVAVFPANVHMAMQQDQSSHVPAWLLIARLPLQAILIAWVHWACVGSPSTLPTELPDQRL